MSSRLAFDRDGRLVAIETDGTVWLVLGDSFQTDGLAVYFMAGETRRASRSATARERHESQRHAPYRPSVSRQEREQQPKVPDELLAEKEAVRLARLEQQRRPVDLIGRAA